MNRLIYLMLLLGANASLFSQSFNTVLRDQLTYTQDLNDVWGYVDPNGTEYALVGTVTGLSIVSLADPDNISEVAFIPGSTSNWRDMKTYGEYAYMVADQGSDGVVVVDLSNLPTSATSQSFTFTVAGGALTRAHNIYIDVPTGLAYIAGGNRNSGGMIILDLATDPAQPTVAALAPAIYSHDVYVNNNWMYASEIYQGRLNIYDVSDINNIVSLGSSITPEAFTHNAWSNPSNTYVFTTDERPNAPTAAYDISDPANPVLIDEFFPPRSTNTNTIPHNAHVLNDYLIISHYTDGIEIVDASVPGNLIEVGYYDTWSGANGGFNGTWGAYPFLPSGLILASDIDNGLFVIEPTYVRAARLQGTVTDGENGPALNGVTVSITNPDGTVVTTNAAGFYETGFANFGTYTVTFSAPGYIDVTQSLDFVSGENLVLDTFLIVDVNNLSMVSGNVTETGSGLAIENAIVTLEGPDASYEATSNASGQVNFGDVINDTYNQYAGKWGYQNTAEQLIVSGATVVNEQLTPGYLDGFCVDQGWTASTPDGATSGFWERAVPVETILGTDISNPGNDAPAGTDLGERAYVTGNGGGTAGNDDIDDGTVQLVSPSFDLSLFSDPSLVVISYQYWFYNGGGSTAPDDNMTVSISNGSVEEIIATYTVSASSWRSASFDLRDLSIPLTTNLRVIVRASDLGAGHVVEGGFDDFRIFENPALPVELVAFNARKTGKKTALLSWQTASETANAGFAIERSTDNGVTFVEIGYVRGAGDSREANDYAFTDTAPATGINFYRLRQLDFSGRFSFSLVKSLDFGPKSTNGLLTLFPNPTNEVIGLNNPLPTTITIYNTDGRVLLQREVGNDARIWVGDLPNGTYWLREGSTSLPFIKQ